MPILGRSGESISQRLFGNAGAGQTTKTLTGFGAPLAVAKRALQGMTTAGGYLGAAVKTPTASANEGDGNTPFDQAAYDKQQEQEMGMDDWAKRTQAPSALNAPAKSSLGAAAKAQKDALAKNKKDSDADAKAKKENDTSQKKIDAINLGYNNIGSEFDAAQKSVNDSKDLLSGLGKVSNNYRTSIENYKNKQDTAIAGNKTMIENNQKEELDNLAKGLRDNNARTNVMLGAASNGSAGRAFARLAAENAGTQRAQMLTTQGDKMSYQNQASIDAKETYDKDRAYSYEWEKTSMEEEMALYQEQLDALEGLRNNQSGWRNEDIKAEAANKLEELKASLKGIQMKGENFRFNLRAKNEEYGGRAEELDNAAISVNAPAELNTPKFSENIDFTNTNNTEDFFDPNKPARVIIGRDAAGNPIYGDAPVTA